MKTKIILMLSTFILSAATAFAQKISEDKVPAEVLSSFKLKFPSSTAKEWEIEDDSEYEADFDWKGKKYSAKFDKSGEWLETETEIKAVELPKSVSGTIANEFTGFKIDEAEKAETANHGIVYEVKLKKDNEVLEVKLSADGKVLEKKTKENEKEND
ncbi:PepSY-like domain-containing protein [Flavobacterium enshiense]|uniref:PepSY-like domain-containing protein n=1 Tax=Flavobacterium enshiense TaxID=1341165 RepID=UPI00345D944E